MKRKYAHLYTLSSDKKTWTYHGDLAKFKLDQAKFKKLKLNSLFLFGISLLLLIYPTICRHPSTFHFKFELPFILQFIFTVFLAFKVGGLYFSPSVMPLHKFNELWLSLKVFLMIPLIFALGSLIGLFVDQILGPSPYDPLLWVNQLVFIILSIFAIKKHQSIPYETYVDTISGKI